MDCRHPEAFAQLRVQFLTDHFATASFHTSGFHDNGVLKLKLVLFDEVEQCISHPDKYYILPGLVERRELFNQCVVLVEVESAFGIVGAVDQILHHINQ